jgi:cytochrome c oxidase cbb3-type subunit III
MKRGACTVARSYNARLLLVAIVLAGVTILAGCDREQRRFQEPSSASAPAQSLSLSELQAGPQTPQSPSSDPYGGNAYAVSEGKRLYSWYNCEGCHAKGGGGIGPPLMDANWIYGAEPANIFATIVQGRPNGMPSFKGRIPEYQVWQLVAYVRSMSGLLRKDVAPSRDDHIQAKKPEQSQDEQKPRASSTPPASTQSQ